MLDLPEVKNVPSLVPSSKTRYLISSRSYPNSSEYRQVSIPHFHEWIKDKDIYQLDIETNVVEELTERVIYAIQFGDVEGETQWVVDYASLPEEAITYFKNILNDPSTQKIIHNAKFEYTVIKWCMGIDIANIFDTMLALQVSTQGKRVPPDLYSLAGALKHLFGIEMSKDEQTTFDGEMMSEAQVVYAATDVQYMGILKRHIESLETYENDKHTITLENNVVRGFGDILTNGFEWDTEQWEKNIAWAQPQVDEALGNMHRVMREEFYEDCVDLGFIYDEDTCDINWNSSKQKAEIIPYLHPDLEKFTKPALKVYEKKLEEDENLLYYLINDEKEMATKFMIVHYRNLLIDLGYLHTKGEVSINMNSHVQRLQLFQLIDPTLQDTQEDTLKDMDHPVITAYKKYVKKTRLISSYGKKFYNFIGTDGKIRARGLRQILNTGRVSMSKPGIMTIPADEEKEEEGGIGNRYRKAFLPTPGWKIVASDYASQELAVIAYLANETVWLDAIRNGWDLHSVCASLVFKDKWVDAGGDPEGKSKPKTIEAKRLRTFTKTISFGLAYGGGFMMLSTRLGISHGDAKQLIEDYFSTFPKLRKYFEERADKALTYGWIDTAPPFKRRRYFPEWRSDFSMGREVKASIGREGKNTSIQGTGADGTKCAMVLIKDHIEKNNLDDRVRILMMLHDAIICEAREDFAKEWSEIMTELMIQGHEINIPNRLILADTEITDYWTK